MMKKKREKINEKKTIQKTRKKKGYIGRGGKRR